MDYKQKYEDALNRAKTSFDKANGLILKNWLTNIFPELKESEDEKTGKQLLNWFKNCSWDLIDDGKLKREDIITWLEKQGEHKKFRDSIQANDQVTKNEDGVLVNLSQLKRVAKQGEKKPTKWSEDDEWMLIEVLITVHDKINYVGTDKKAISSITEQISWLKSLKKRMKGE